MRKALWLAVLFLAGLCAGAASAQYVTITGPMQAANGLPAANMALSFAPTQTGFIAGTGVMVQTATFCATDALGSVVGIAAPQQPPFVAVGGTGTLAAGTYFVEQSFYDAAGNTTTASPEVAVQLTATGSLLVGVPSGGFPANAVGTRVYIGTASGGEVAQGSAASSMIFTQVGPLVSGVPPLTTNSTLCRQVANDALWPTGTGYTVTLTDTSGNTIPGFPMTWRLLGPNTTISLATGLPVSRSSVYFPSPILATPLSHAGQSISGPLSLGGYGLTAGSLGIGTNIPAWPVDVENGPINTSGGYLYNGGIGVTAGQCLVAGTDALHSFKPSTCFAYTSPTLFYQTVQGSGVAYPARPTLNFSARFLVSSTSSQTNVELATSGNSSTLATAVAPYIANHCVKFDGNGNLVDAGGACVTAASTDYYWTQAGCTPAIGNNQSCLATVNLPGPMPDANYILTCNVNKLSGPASLAGGGIDTPQGSYPANAGGALGIWVSVIQQNGESGGPSTTIGCHAHHN